jgi:prefoldin subunit 5
MVRRVFFENMNLQEAIKNLDDEIADLTKTRDKASFDLAVKTAQVKKLKKKLEEVTEIMKG